MNKEKSGFILNNSNLTTLENISPSTVGFIASTKMLHKVFFCFYVIVVHILDLILNLSSVVFKIVLKGSDYLQTSRSYFRCHNYKPSREKRYIVK